MAGGSEGYGRGLRAPERAMSHSLLPRLSATIAAGQSTAGLNVAYWLTAREADPAR